MDLLKYRYEIESQFLPPILFHAFKLRCTPMEIGCQHIIERSLTVSPEPLLLEACDCFGNRIHYGSISNEHTSFRVVSEGVVECGTYLIEEQSPDDLFLFPSSLTRCNAEMLTRALRIKERQRETALAVMHEVHQRLTYERFVTDNTTTAEWVFNNRKGVCQDYAHLMIALCRAAGLHARYVAGLVVGEGESHAWVEVYENGAWKGFDPTYDKQIETGYIKLAHGRDAADCPLNRGRFYQWTSEQLSVKTTVKETKEVFVLT